MSMFKSIREEPLSNKPFTSLAIKPGEDNFYWIVSVTIMLGAYSTILNWHLAKSIANVEPVGRLEMLDASTPNSELKSSGSAQE